jgi:hypothetical protein
MVEFISLKRVKIGEEAKRLRLVRVRSPFAEITTPGVLIDDHSAIRVSNKWAYSFET